LKERIISLLGKIAFQGLDYHICSRWGISSCPSGGLGSGICKRFHLLVKAPYTHQQVKNICLETFKGARQDASQTQPHLTQPYLSLLKVLISLQ